MSLENQIERLTAAIEKLNANIELVLSTPVNQPVAVVQAAPVIDQAVKAIDEAINKAAVSVDEAQALCLSLSRKDPSNKNKIKALLAEYKAMKVADLVPEALQEFVKKLGQL